MAKLFRPGQGKPNRKQLEARIQQAEGLNRQLYRQKQMFLAAILGLMDKCGCDSFHLSNEVAELQMGWKLESSIKKDGGGVEFTIIDKGEAEEKEASGIILA